MLAMPTPPAAEMPSWTRDIRSWRLDDVAETELLPLRAFLILERGHGYHAAMPGTRHGTVRRPIVLNIPV
jgi:hypothetical protein